MLRTLALSVAVLATISGGAFAAGIKSKCDSPTKEFLTDFEKDMGQVSVKDMSPTEYKAFLDLANSKGHDAKGKKITIAGDSGIIVLVPKIQEAMILFTKGKDDDSKLCVVMPVPLDAVMKIVGANSPATNEDDALPPSPKSKAPKVEGSEGV